MDLDAYLGARHHVVDLAALLALGVTERFAEMQLAARRWQRVHPAVYCGHTGPLGFESRCEAALLHAGAGAALDAGTAASIHGLRGFEADPIEIVLPHDRRIVRRPGVVIRRSRTLTARSVTTREGLRVVRVERSVLSLALTRPARAHGVVLAAVQQGLTTADRLRGCLLGLGRVAHRRTVAAAIDDADGGSRSWCEARFRRILRQAGLPQPAQNHPLLVGGRRVWLDACYVDERIAIELDGRAYHLLSEDWEHDLRRQNEVVLAGWQVLRFLARQLRERPDEVADAVRRALTSSWGRSAAS